MPRAKKQEDPFFAWRRSEAAFIREAQKLARVVEDAHPNVFLFGPVGVIDLKPFLESAAKHREIVKQRDAALPWPGKKRSSAKEDVDG